MKAAGLSQGPENLLFLATCTQSRPGTRHILSQGREGRLRPEEQLKCGPAPGPEEPTGQARPRPRPQVGPAPEKRREGGCCSRLAGHSPAPPQIEVHGAQRAVVIQTLRGTETRQVCSQSASGVELGTRGARGRAGRLRLGAFHGLQRPCSCLRVDIGVREPGPLRSAAVPSPSTSPRGPGGVTQPPG